MKRPILVSRDDLQAHLSDSAFSLSDDALDGAFAITGGQPEIVAWLANRLAEYAHAKQKDFLQVPDVELVLNRAVQGQQPALIQIWDSLGTAERVLLLVLTQQEEGHAISLGRDPAHPGAAESWREALDGYGIRLAGTDLTAALNRVVQRGFVQYALGDGERKAASPRKHLVVVGALRRWLEVQFPFENIGGLLDEMNPRAVDAYEQAWEQHREGDLAAALTGYQQVLTINPNHGRAWLGLAQVLQEQGQSADAVEAFWRAYELNRAQSRDGLLDALLSYGQLLQRQGNDSAALKVYQQVLSVAPDNRIAKQNQVIILTRRAETLLAQGDMDQARDVLRVVVELEPGDSKARLAEIEAQRRSAAALTGIPSARWRRQDWKALVSLTVGLCVIGLAVFWLSRTPVSGLPLSSGMSATPDSTHLPVASPANVAPLPTISPLSASLTPALVRATGSAPDMAAANTGSWPPPASPEQAESVPVALRPISSSPLAAASAPAVGPATPHSAGLVTQHSTLALALDTPEPLTITPTSSPTSVPSPTATRNPTATRRPPTATPTATATHTVTPTPTPSPTPTLRFGEPQLMAPDNGSYFSGSETSIELRWAPVGLLAEDEWYGLSVRYRHGGQNVETGAWLKENYWRVPQYLAGQADEPERRYEWSVTLVQELGKDPDGSRKGVGISPKSEQRNFVWR